MTPSGRPSPDSMITLGAWAFWGFGALITVLGIVTTFDDPAGIAAIVFGLAFVGVGFVVKKVFGTPAGMKEVTVQGHTAAIRTTTGQAGTRTQGYRILVDENASEAQIAEAKARFVNEQLESRPGWSTGRIEEEGARDARWLPWGAALWIVFAAGFWIAYTLESDVFWMFVALGGTAFAVGFSVAAIRARMHARKFGRSYFQLERTPVVLGERLQGTLVTGVPFIAGPKEDFRLVLECVHVWEEPRTHRDAPTRTHHDVLWKASAREPGQMATGPQATLIVPVAIELPVDKPAATLTRGSEGIRWTLSVHLPMAGLDYRASFELPVVSA